MEHQRDESAKWSQAANKVMEKWEETTQDLLEKNAARGFPAPDGTTLDLILGATLEAQRTLTEANGKLYNDQRERIYQVEEFNLKLAVELAKLLMEWYKVQLLNELAEEQAQQEAQIEQWRGDIIRINAETERREAAIIIAKAEIEQEINGYKEQQILAEFQTLDAEVRLIRAKIATAEAKLQIIDSLWEVINAEHLVIAAEQRRAAALEEVLTAKKALAAVQQSMIPLHMQKAGAREKQAGAAAEEAQVKAEIEELGYDRIALKSTQESADSQVREAEEVYEQAQESLVRITRAVELLRSQSRRTLQEYQNLVREAVIRGQGELRKGEIDLRLDSLYQRHAQESGTEVALLNHLKAVADTSFANKIQNINAVAVDNAATISSGAFQVHNSETHTVYRKRILKGG